MSKRVFKVVGTQVFIGDQPLSSEMRELLREQARYISTSQLWEVFNAAIINEASNLALIQSETWEHIQAAKMLHHWGHVFRNAIHTLTKQDSTHQ